MAVEPLTPLVRHSVPSVPRRPHRYPAAAAGSLYDLWLTPQTR